MPLADFSLKLDGLLRTEMRLDVRPARTPDLVRLFPSLLLRKRAFVMGSLQLLLRRQQDGPQLLHLRGAELEVFFESLQPLRRARRAGGWSGGPAKEGERRRAGFRKEKGAGS